MKEPTGASTSRAGRNLPAAIGSGVFLGLLVIFSLFTVKWLFAVVVVVALIIAVREFVQAFSQRGVHLSRMPLLLGAAAIPAAAYLYGLTGQAIAFGLLVLVTIFWRIRRGIDGYVADITASTFVLAYLPFLAGFLMLTLTADNGPWRVFVFILLTVGNDIGGYAAGVIFGRHPIASHISPKKSWEGFAGSVITQAIIGALAFTYFLDAPWWQGVIAGLVMTVSATAGDFAESAMKRDLGLKDMGSLLPGHGGMMDRLDSLLPNAFVSWALFTFFLGS